MKQLGLDHFYLTDRWYWWWSFLKGPQHFIWFIIPYSFLVPNLPNMVESLCSESTSHNENTEYS